MIRIGEGPTAADRHEARVSHFREDHGGHSLLSTRLLPMPTVLGESWSTKLALHDPDQGVDDEEEHHL
jgi:hypothetical protein